MKIRVVGSQTQFMHPQKEDTIIMPEDENKMISPIMIKRIFQVASLSY